MARLWAQLKASDSSRDKEVSRLATERVEATLAVGKGNVYGHTWDRDIYAQINKDSSLFVTVQIDRKTVARIEISETGEIKVSQ